MAEMYTPDIREYQQIPLGGATGGVDCTAWGAAILTDAHTQGKITTTGRAVRLHSNEAVPNDRSPGLNLIQVDDSVFKITGGKVDLDTRVQGMALSRDQIRNRIIDGRWANIQVVRRVLIERGFGGGNSFDGLHDITVHARSTDLIPVIGDPLVPHYIPASWDAVFDAAEAIPGIPIYSQFTRDLTPDYQWTLRPASSARRIGFFRYRLDGNGHISGRMLFYTGGIYHKRCTTPRAHVAAPGKPAKWSRQLVTLTEGKHEGWIVDAQYAKEINP